MRYPQPVQIIVQSNEESRRAPVRVRGDTVLKAIEESD
jgi:hypothetical protein